MLRFAEIQFALSAVQDGATIRQHLEAVARQTGEIPQELQQMKETPCPDALAHVWLMFLDLHRARSSNGFGANAISYTELAAWSAMNAVNVSPYEIGALRELDGMWMAAQAKQAKQSKQSKQAGSTAR